MIEGSAAGRAFQGEWQRITITDTPGIDRAMSSRYPFSASPCISSP